MPRRYGITDLPWAETAGGVGRRAVRSTATGRTYVATPIAVRAKYLSPMVQERRYWERRRRAGGREEDPGGSYLVKCALCGVCVGRGYVHTALYLQPTLPDRRDPAKVDWLQVCATCGASDADLPYGYCLVAEDDWPKAERAGAEVAVDEALLTTKLEELEDALLPLWTRARALADEAGVLPTDEEGAPVVTDELEDVFLAIARKADPPMHTWAYLAHVALSRTHEASLALAGV